MRVLVTGGSGFTGRRVLPRLVAAGHDVSALARADGAATAVAVLGARPLMGDLDDGAGLRDAFRDAKADVLVNLASLGFGHTPAIVDAARHGGIDRAVFVSTTAIFTPLDAPSKRVRVEAERLVQTSRLDWTIVRPTMIYGASDDRNMWRLLRALRRAPVFPLPGGGRRLQQPVHVEDLADAIVASAATAAAIGNAYELAGPEALTLRRIIEQAGAAVGRSPRLVAVPLAPAIAGVRLYERAVRHPRIQAEQIERLAEDKAFDVSAAQRDLGFAPRSFSGGITAEAALML